MNSIIKLKSYSDGELILSEEYKGSWEKKGRYLRYEYEDKEGALTHMVVCFEDEGLYRLESQGERKLLISCTDGVGKAILSIGAHSLEGGVSKFRSQIKESTEGYKTEINYVLSFSVDQKTRTKLIIEAKQ